MGAWDDMRTCIWEGRGYEVRRVGEDVEIGGLRCPVRLVSVHHGAVGVPCGKVRIHLAYFQKPLEAWER
jgi:hypothetical protein